MLDLDATMKDLTDGSTISIDDMLDDDMLESHATMKDPSCGCNIARKNDNQKVSHSEYRAIRINFICSEVANLQSLNQMLSQLPPNPIRVLGEGCLYFRSIMLF